MRPLALVFLGFLAGCGADGAPFVPGATGPEYAPDRTIGAAPTGTLTDATAGRPEAETTEEDAT